MTKKRIKNKIILKIKKLSSQKIKIVYLNIKKYIFLLKKYKN